ncbi:MAG TPA: DUF6457 domain-containing protein [Gaiellaceae bacterium]|nr:DUF6457 domain-containing protein [Casimicrobiaceae bacterium]HKU58028.1 DUF6457 domain-containing protein [Gaiellaceae bacterium]
MHEWLQSAGAKLGGIELTADEQRDLLELARVAAHTSGDRRNAPLVTYMVGIARGRGDTRSVAEIVRDIDVP